MGISILIAIFVGDALLKLWIERSLPLISSSPYVYPYGGIGVFQDFFGIEFSLVHATNTGAAWSLFSDYTFLLLLLRIMLIPLLIYCFIKEKAKILKLAIGFIIAGALGNILDIFLYGHVIDMFHFVFWGYRYPVFNIADSAICLGAILYFIYSRQTRRDSKETAQ